MYINFFNMLYKIHFTIFFFRKEEMHENQIFCEPCLYGDKEIKAFYFCKTCADPEPLCENCAQQHTRHKASRNHEISNDLTQMSSLDDASNQK